MIAICSNHSRDSFGWPLGNCQACIAYRQKLDAWYCDQVMAGNHRPELFALTEHPETEMGL
jgi:hypothetical protein